MGIYRWLVGLAVLSAVVVLAWAGGAPAAGPSDGMTRLSLPNASPVVTPASPVATPAIPLLAQAAYPPQVNAPAHPTNYGDRYATDANGRPVTNDFIVVLHETVGSAQSAINLFQRNHPRDEDQVSYHTLIGRDGTVYYIVPPENRAFGAGNSVFNGPNGPETVATNPAFPSSVNNFAYHVSLESPSDGRDNRRSHSGYTPAQYESLAWLLAQTTIPDNRITTHQAVDRSGSRMDPRSFDSQQFWGLLRQYPSRVGLSG